MSIARVVELTGGVATFLLGVIVALTFFKQDVDTSRQLEIEFRPLRDLCILLIFFAGPNLLVAVGAYFHAVRRDLGPGLVMILFGTAFVIGVFVLLFFAGYAALALIGPRFLTVVFTLITAGISFVVHLKSR